MKWLENIQMHILAVEEFDINRLPYMPILGSSNSTTKKDMMSKIWTNGDTII